jgi:hypothetical protein
MRQFVVAFISLIWAFGFVKGQAITVSNDFFTVPTNTVLNMAAPGVLANDTGGKGPLTAILVSGAAHGILSLTNHGSFSYLPTNNYSGIDTFTYQATDRTTTSAVATVAIDVLPAGQLFYDSFMRPVGSSSIFPWTLNLATPDPALNPSILTLRPALTARLGPTIPFRPKFKSLPSTESAAELPGG